MINNVLKTILNNLRRNRLLTAINVVGLTLSIIVSIIIIGHVQNELKYDKSIDKGDKLFRLETNWASMPSFIGHVLTQDLSTINNTRLSFQEDMTIKYKDDEPLTIKNVAFADSTFFDIMPFQLIRANTEKTLRTPFQIYLTEKEAIRVFGNRNPIGELLLVENKYAFQVAGIIKNIEYSHLSFDAVISMVTLPELKYKKVLEKYDGWSFPTYILLPENISKYDAEQKINQCLAKYGYDKFIDRFTLRNYNEIYFTTNISNEAGTIHGNRKANRILLLVSIFVIILAIINYINLSTANAHKRYKWIGVNRIVGASRGRIIVQFLVETILICMVSLWFAILIIELINTYLSQFLPIQLILKNLYTFKNMVYMALAILLMSFLSGIYPAIALSRYQPINLVQKNKASISKGITLRDILTIVQFIIAIALITSTILIYKQFKYISESNLGFNSQQVLIIKTNKELENNFEVFKNKLLENPKILNVSYSLRIPGNEWGSWCCTRIDGKEHKYFSIAVDPNYLATLNIKLKDGRNFDWSRKGDVNSAFLLNETALKEYEIENPLGKYVDNTGSGFSGSIIGVVEDFHFRGFHYKIEPVIMCWNPNIVQYANILIQKSQVQRSLSIIKKTWEDIYPEFPFDYKFLDEKFNEQYKSDLSFGQLVGIFSLVAIFIACIGILGFSFFYINQETKNIGIRKVHGATSAIIAKMLTSDIVKLIGVAYIIAVPLVYYLIKSWLENFAYKIELTIWPFILGGAIALTLALITVIWQTGKAAKRNPVESLRYE